MSSVIVFGPTGQSGSAAARTAAKHGAKVWLAMRDTNKPIPGIDKASEEKAGYSRVQADVFDTDSVKKAVETSGAKRAFIYMTHGNKDHMKSAFQALKDGGVEFVVFLSSFTIPIDRGSLRNIPPEECLPYIHAQPEANLDDIFGEDHYVALRPGAFASNLLQYKDGIVAGKVSMFSGVFETDNVNPEDIGNVAGAVLVNGPKQGQKKVYIYGPEIRTMRESTEEIARLLGKKVEIDLLTWDEEYQKMLKHGLPEQFAKYMVDVHSNAGPDKGDGVIRPHYEEGVKNVELYTGQPSRTLAQWVEANKALFQ